MSKEHKFSAVNYDQDEGEATFAFTLADDGKSFSLEVTSTHSMTDEEAVLAILVWAKDEIEKLS